MKIEFILLLCSVTLFCSCGGRNQDTGWWDSVGVQVMVVNGGENMNQLWVIYCAPFDGVVSCGTHHVGEELKPVEPFARVIDLGRLRVAFSVPEHEVGLLPVGTTAKAVIPALDDKEFALRVSDKSLVANPLGHTYKVYGTMLTQGSSAINSAGMLPDMVAKVKVDIDTKAGIVVPAECVQVMPEGTIVWVVEGGKAYHRVVTVGDFIRNGVMVESGLNAGDSVIVSGQQKLYTGAKVKIESWISNFEFQNSKLSTDSRPESRLLQINVESQELLKKMAVGETLPQLAILGIGYYGNAVRNDASANAVAGFSLKIPLSDWWNTSHKIREHNIRIEQARVEKEHYGNLMSIEEEKAYSDMVDACMLIRSDSVALRLARENYRLAEINYAAGVVTVSDVLQAHALLLQAENAVVDRRVSYLIARRRLSDLRIEK